MAKGLYGQLQGNESRIGTAVQTDHFHASDVAEGHEVAVLNRMLKERDWKGVEKFTSELKAAGHAQWRIDSIINKASYGVRL